MKNRKISNILAVLTIILNIALIIMNIIQEKKHAKSED